MPTYRYEMSSTSRASCQNVECKTNGPKIQKGELRFGSWTDYGDFQGWKWKHWGCVTPLQIGNIQADLEGLDLDNERDMEILDGWEDLPDEAKDRIREALRIGHVADEEWKGDIEKNRPGQRGMRSSRKKKAAVEDDLPAGETDETPVKSKPKRKPKGKKAAASADDDENDEPERDSTPVPVKKGRKKVKGEEPDESAEEVIPTKKKRAPPKKRKIEEEDDEIKTEETPVREPPTKKVKGKRRAIKDELESTEEVSVKDEEPTPAPAKKRGRPKKVKNQEAEEEPAGQDEIELPERLAVRDEQEEEEVIKEEPVEDDENTMADLPESKSKSTKRARGKAGKAKADLKAEVEGAVNVKDEPVEDGATTSTPPKPAKKARGKKQTAVKAEAADSELDEEQELEQKPKNTRKKPSPEPVDEAAPKRRGRHKKAAAAS